MTTYAMGAGQSNVGHTDDGHQTFFQNEAPSYDTMPPNEKARSVYMLKDIKYSDDMISKLEEYLRLLEGYNDQYGYEDDPTVKMKSSGGLDFYDPHMEDDGQGPFIQDKGFSVYVIKGSDQPVSDENQEPEINGNIKGNKVTLLLGSKKEKKEPQDIDSKVQEYLRKLDGDDISENDNEKLDQKITERMKIFFQFTPSAKDDETEREIDIEDTENETDIKEETANDLEFQKVENTDNKVSHKISGFFKGMLPKDSKEKEVTDETRENVDLEANEFNSVIEQKSEPKLSEKKKTFFTVKVTKEINENTTYMGPDVEGEQVNDNDVVDENTEKDKEQEKVDINIAERMKEFFQFTPSDTPQIEVEEDTDKEPNTTTDNVQENIDIEANVDDTSGIEIEKQKSGPKLSQKVKRFFKVKSTKQTRKKDENITDIEADAEGEQANDNAVVNVTTERYIANYENEIGENDEEPIIKEETEEVKSKPNLSEKVKTFFTVKVTKERNENTTDMGPDVEGEQVNDNDVVDENTEKDKEQEKLDINIAERMKEFFQFTPSDTPQIEEEEDTDREPNTTTDNVQENIDIEANVDDPSGIEIEQQKSGPKLSQKVKRFFKVKSTKQTRKKDENITDIEADAEGEQANGNAVVNVTTERYNENYENEIGENDEEPIIKEETEEVKSKPNLSEKVKTFFTVKVTKERNENTTDIGPDVEGEQVNDNDVVDENTEKDKEQEKLDINIAERMKEFFQFTPSDTSQIEVEEDTDREPNTTTDNVQENIDIEANVDDPSGIEIEQQKSGPKLSQKVKRFFKVKSTKQTRKKDENITYIEADSEGEQVNDNAVVNVTTERYIANYENEIGENDEEPIIKEETEEVKSKPNLSEKVKTFFTVKVTKERNENTTDMGPDVEGEQVNDNDVVDENTEKDKEHEKLDINIAERMKEFFQFTPSDTPQIEVEEDTDKEPNTTADNVQENIDIEANVDGPSGIEIEQQKSGPKLSQKVKQFFKVKSTKETREKDENITDIEAVADAEDDQANDNPVVNVTTERYIANYENEIGENDDEPIIKEETEEVKSKPNLSEKVKTFFTVKVTKERNENTTDMGPDVEGEQVNDNNVVDENTEKDKEHEKLDINIAERMKEFFQFTPSDTPQIEVEEDTDREPNTTTDNVQENIDIEANVDDLSGIEIEQQKSGPKLSQKVKRFFKVKSTKETREKDENITDIEAVADAEDDQANDNPVVNVTTERYIANYENEIRENDDEPIITEETEEVKSKPNLSEKVKTFFTVKVTKERNENTTDMGSDVEGEQVNDNDVVDENTEKDKEHEKLDINIAERMKEFFQFTPSDTSQIEVEEDTDREPNTTTDNVQENIDIEANVDDPSGIEIEQQKSGPKLSQKVKRFFKVKSTKETREKDENITDIEAVAEDDQANANPVVNVTTERYIANYENEIGENDDEPFIKEETEEVKSKPNLSEKMKTFFTVKVTKEINENTTDMGPDVEGEQVNDNNVVDENTEKDKEHEKLDINIAERMKEFFQFTPSDTPQIEVEEDTDREPDTTTDNVQENIDIEANVDDPSGIEIEQQKSGPKLSQKVKRFFKVKSTKETRGKDENITDIEAVADAEDDQANDNPVVNVTTERYIANYENEIGENDDEPIIKEETEEVKSKPNLSEKVKTFFTVKVTKERNENTTDMGPDVEGEQVNDNDVVDENTEKDKEHEKLDINIAERMKEFFQFTPSDTSQIEVEEDTDREPNTTTDNVQENIDIEANVDDPSGIEIEQQKSGPKLSQKVKQFFKVKSTKETREKDENITDIEAVAEDDQANDNHVVNVTTERYIANYENEIGENDDEPIIKEETEEVKSKPNLSEKVKTFFTVKVTKERNENTTDMGPDVEGEQVNDNDVVDENTEKDKEHEKLDINIAERMKEFFQLTPSDTPQIEVEEDTDKEPNTTTDNVQENIDIEANVDDPSGIEIEQQKSGPKLSQKVKRFFKVKSTKETREKDENITDIEAVVDAEDNQANDNPVVNVTTERYIANYENEIGENDDEPIIKEETEEVKSKPNLSEKVKTFFTVKVTKEINENTTDMGPDVEGEQVNDVVDENTEKDKEHEKLDINIAERMKEFFQLTPSDTSQIEVEEDTDKEPNTTADNVQENIDIEANVDDPSGIEIEQQKSGPKLSQKVKQFFKVKSTKETREKDENITDIEAVTDAEGEQANDNHVVNVTTERYIANDENEIGENDEEPIIKEETEEVKSKPKLSEKVKTFFTVKVTKERNENTTDMGPDFEGEQVNDNDVVDENTEKDKEQEKLDINIAERMKEFFQLTPSDTPQIEVEEDTDKEPNTTADNVQENIDIEANVDDPSGIEIEQQKSGPKLSQKVKRFFKVKSTKETREKDENITDIEAVADAEDDQANDNPVVNVNTERYVANDENEIGENDEEPIIKDETEEVKSKPNLSEKVKTFFTVKVTKERNENTTDMGPDVEGEQVNDVVDENTEKDKEHEKLDINIAERMKEFFQLTPSDTSQIEVEEDTDKEPNTTADNVQENIDIEANVDDPSGIEIEQQKSGPKLSQKVKRFFKVKSTKETREKDENITDIEAVTDAEGEQANDNHVVNVTTERYIANDENEIGENDEEPIIKDETEEVKSKPKLSEKVKTFFTVKVTKERNENTTDMGPDFEGEQVNDNDVVDENTEKDKEQEKLDINIAERMKEFFQLTPSDTPQIEVEEDTDKEPNTTADNVQENIDIEANVDDPSGIKIEQQKSGPKLSQKVKRFFKVKSTKETREKDENITVIEAVADAEDDQANDNPVVNVNTERYVANDENEIGENDEEPIIKDETEEVKSKPNLSEKVKTFFTVKVTKERNENTTDMGPDVEGEQVNDNDVVDENTEKDKEQEKLDINIAERMKEFFQFTPSDTPQIEVEEDTDREPNTTTDNVQENIDIEANVDGPTGIEIEQKSEPKLSQKVKQFFKVKSTKQTREKNENITDIEAVADAEGEQANDNPVLNVTTERYVANDENEIGKNDEEPIIKEEIKEVKSKPNLSEKVKDFFTVKVTKERNENTTDMGPDVEGEQVNDNDVVDENIEKDKEHEKLDINIAERMKEFFQLTPSDTPQNEVEDDTEKGTNDFTDKAEDMELEANSDNPSGVEIEQQKSGPKLSQKVKGFFKVKSAKKNKGKDENITDIEAVVDAEGEQANDNPVVNITTERYIANDENEIGENDEEPIIKEEIEEVKSKPNLSEKVKDFFTVKVTKERNENTTDMGPDVEGEQVNDNDVVDENTEKDKELEKVDINIAERMKEFFQLTPSDTPQIEVEEDTDGEPNINTDNVQENIDIEANVDDSNGIEIEQQKSGPKLSQKVKQFFKVKSTKETREKDENITDIEAVADAEGEQATDNPVVNVTTDVHTENGIRDNKEEPIIEEEIEEVKSKPNLSEKVKDFFKVKVTKQKDENTTNMEPGVDVEVEQVNDNNVVDVNTGKDKDHEKLDINIAERMKEFFQLTPSDVPKDEETEREIDIEDTEREPDIKDEIDNDLISADQNLEKTDNKVSDKLSGFFKGMLPKDSKERDAKDTSQENEDLEVNIIEKNDIEIEQKSEPKLTEKVKDFFKVKVGKGKDENNTDIKTVVDAEGEQANDNPVVNVTTGVYTENDGNKIGQNGEGPIIKEEIEEVKSKPNLSEKVKDFFKVKVTKQKDENTTNMEPGVDVEVEQVNDNNVVDVNTGKDKDHEKLDINIAERMKEFFQLTPSDVPKDEETEREIDIEDTERERDDEEDDVKLADTIEGRSDKNVPGKISGFFKGILPKDSKDDTSADAQENLELETDIDDPSAVEIEQQNSEPKLSAKVKDFFKVKSPKVSKEKHEDNIQNEDSDTVLRLDDEGNQNQPENNLEKEPSNVSEKIQVFLKGMLSPKKEKESEENERQDDADSLKLKSGDKVEMDSDNELSDTEDTPKKSSKLPKFFKGIFDKGTKDKEFKEDIYQQDETEDGSAWKAYEDAQKDEEEIQPVIEGQERKDKVKGSKIPVLFAKTNKQKNEKDSMENNTVDNELENNTSDLKNDDPEKDRVKSRLEDFFMLKKSQQSEEDNIQQIGGGQPSSKANNEFSVTILKEFEKTYGKNNDQGMNEIDDPIDRITDGIPEQSKQAKESRIPVLSSRKNIKDSVVDPEKDKSDKTDLFEDFKKSLQDQAKVHELIADSLAEADTDDDENVEHRNNKSDTFDQIPVKEMKDILDSERPPSDNVEVTVIKGEDEDIDEVEPLYLESPSQKPNTTMPIDQDTKSSENEVKQKESRIPVLSDGNRPNKNDSKNDTDFSRQTENQILDIDNLKGASNNIEQDSAAPVSRIPRLSDSKVRRKEAKDKDSDTKTINDNNSMPQDTDVDTQIETSPSLQENQVENINFEKPYDTVIENGLEPQDIIERHDDIENGIAAVPPCNEDEEKAVVGIEDPREMIPDPLNGEVCDNNIPDQLTQQLDEEQPPCNEEEAVVGIEDARERIPDQLNGEVCDNNIPDELTKPLHEEQPPCNEQEAVAGIEDARERVPNQLNGEVCDNNIPEELTKPLHEEKPPCNEQEAVAGIEDARERVPNQLNGEVCDNNIPDELTKPLHEEQPPCNEQEAVAGIEDARERVPNQLNGEVCDNNIPEELTKPLHEEKPPCNEQEAVAGIEDARERNPDQLNGQVCDNNIPDELTKPLHEEQPQKEPLLSPDNNVNEDNQEGSSIPKDDEPEEDDSAIWESVVRDQLTSHGDVENAAVVDVNYPVNFKSATFQPSLKGVKSLIDALEGDTEVLDEDGLLLGSTEYPFPFTPKKIVKGKQIHAVTPDGEKDCTVYKTKRHIIISTYMDDVHNKAVKRIQDVAKYIQKNLED